MNALLRVVLWIGVSSVLLLVGFSLLVATQYVLSVLVGRVEPEIGRLIATTYFRVVFFKGLLPQLVLALALWATFEQLRPDAARPASRVALGLGFTALLAYAAVAPLLLTVDLLGSPALQLHTTAHHVGTAVGSLAGVVAAGLLGRRVVGRSDRVAASDAYGFS